MYGYILLPYEMVPQPDINLKSEGFTFGALKSSLLTGDFVGQDGVFSQIARGVGQLDDLDSKFSIVAMSQLLNDGKVSNSDALNYFCTGFAHQLGYVVVSMGYQSIDAMKEALRTGNINSHQFLTSLGGFISSLSRQDEIKNINKEEPILIDLVLSEAFPKISETAERRVEAGQTYEEFIHNMPEMFDLTCQFIEGVNYTKDEFEYRITFLRNKKTAVKLVLGNQEPIENVVLVNYTQSKTAPTNGFEYVLSFKKIAVGHIEVRPINTTTLIKSESTVNLVNNPVDKARTDKTEGKHNLGGFKEIVYDLKTLNNSLIEAIK